MPVALDVAYGLNDQVALRPEPFGALAYHYGTRRLVFLRSPDIVDVVRRLGENPDLASTLRSSGVSEQRWPSFISALSSLEESGVIDAR